MTHFNQIVYEFGRLNHTTYHMKAFVVVFQHILHTQLSKDSKQPFSLVVELIYTLPKDQRNEIAQIRYKMTHFTQIVHEFGRLNHTAYHMKAFALFSQHISDIPNYQNTPFS